MIAQSISSLAVVGLVTCVAGLVLYVVFYRVRSIVEGWYK